MADELNRPEIKNFIEAFVEEDIGPGGQYEGMQVLLRPLKRRPSSTSS